MIKKLFFIIMFSTFYVGSLAQVTIGNYKEAVTTDMFPKSPEAAALSKFVDIPAGNYTGVADFSIPLYTIEFDGEKIPIELRYTTTGITVGQVATRVGLGWVLSTGPSLSQQVIGVQDKNFPRFILPPNFNPEYSNSDQQLATLLAGAIQGEAPIDIIPDVFTYNLLTSNGKFIFNAAGSEGVTMPYSQTKITINGGYNDIKMIDEKGFTYYFSSPMSSLSTYNDCMPSLDKSEDPNFRIEKINSPKNQEIKFLYDPNNSLNVNAKYVNSVTTRERIATIGYIPPGYIPSAMGPFANKCVNITTLKSKPLTEIQFKEGMIEFIYNDVIPRQDIPGDLSLKQIIVRNRNNEIIKNFTLNYDYFVSQEKVLMIPRLQNYANALVGADKRLKLINVHDNLTNGTYNLEYYESYNNKNLPNRISNNQDYWGIYNGKDNGEKAIAFSNSNINSPYLNADKSPDINYGKLGNLKKIIYPTGGYTSVEYESDEADISEFPIIEYEYDIDEVSHDVRSSDSNEYHTVFTITNEDPITQNLDFIGNSISPLPLGACYLTLKKPNGSVEIFKGSKTMERHDPVGTYELIITPDTSAYPTTCTASYSWKNIVKTPINTITALSVGTIRVKKIESIDNNGKKITRQYTYKVPTSNNSLPYTQSSGVNQGEQTFGAYTTNMIPLGFEGHYVEEHSVSNNPGWQTSTVRGKSIGYTNVQEYFIDENVSSNSYRKEYSFLNEPSYYGTAVDPYGLSIAWPIDGLERGLLKSEILFDSKNNKVRESIKDYAYDKYFNYKYSNTISNTPSSMGLGIMIKVQKQVLGNFAFKYSIFPLNNYWIQESKTTTRDYVSPTSLVEKVITQNYSVPDYKHTYPVEFVTTGSQGETLRSVLKYPQDITVQEAGGQSQYDAIQELKNRNQLSEAILTKTFNNTLPTSEQRTDFFVFGNNVLPKYVYYKKGESISASDLKVSFGGYDDRGNLTEYTLESGIPVSIIWGYDKTKPIAKIEGAKYEDIKSKSVVIAAINASDSDFNATLSNADQTETDLINTLDALRKDSGLSDYQITTYSYDPLVGVRSVTPPSGLREIYIYDTAQRLKEVKRL
ncbi:hypothetical protein, partial [Soonwooa purpurea]